MRAIATATFLILATPAVGQVLDSVETGEQQTKFHAVITEYAKAYEAAANDMAAGAQRQRRAKAICAILGKKPSVKRWTGFITRLSSNGDGLGVLSIGSSKGITIKTWNNALSDSSDNTLISADSPVMDVAMNLAVGQAVEFSGTFVRDKADCIREGSLTQDGSMREPEFIMKFSSLKQLGDKYEGKKEAETGADKSLLQSLFGSE